MRPHRPPQDVALSADEALLMKLQGPAVNMLRLAEHRVDHVNIFATYPQRLVCVQVLWVLLEH